MCALPLSRVLPQKRTNSLDVDREAFERAQSVSISKAINNQECPVKEKHVRSAIIGTFNEKGAATFWNIVMKLQLQGNPIICWKFCHVLHKVIREGHENVILDSQKYISHLKDLGKLWGLLKDGYGRLIQFYCNLLVAKLKFHLRNSRFPGHLSVTDEELDVIGEHDVNVFFQLSCEFFDLMDEILALQTAVFGSLDMSRSNSMTNCGQCRLAPLIPCVQDSSQLYDYTVKVLFKLHAALPADTLAGHRERFLKQFKMLQQFYISASNLQYFKHLIHVPLLPEVPPNFLVASDLSAHVSPIVILPPHADTPENETIDMNLIDTTIPKNDVNPDLLDGLNLYPGVKLELNSNGVDSPELAEKDALVEQLLKDIKSLKMEIQEIKIESERAIDDYKRQLFGLECHISEQNQTIQNLKDENKILKEKDSPTSESISSELSTQLTLTEKKAKVQEEKFLKMKEVYGKLREEHITLLRTKADQDKQISNLKTTIEDAKNKQQGFIHKLVELCNRVSSQEEIDQVIQNSEPKSSLLIEEFLFKNKNQEMKTQKASQHDILNETGFLNLTPLLNLLSNKINHTQKELSLLQEKKNVKEHDILYLDFILKEAQHIVQNSLDDLNSPTLSTSSCTPEYYLHQLSSIAEANERFQNSYFNFLEDINDIESVLRSTTYFSHLLSIVLMEGKAISNLSPNIEQGEELMISCRQLGSESLSLLKDIQNKSPKENLLTSFQKVSNEISNTMKIMDELVPNMSQDISQKLGDIIESELKQMDKDIEEAARQIQEMLNKSKAGDSGMKLEVNSKILDSCTDLMQSIKVLVHASKELQNEIVSQGKGTASIKEFYNRNHRWTEGLISAAKIVGLGAKFLVNAADKVVSKQTKFEELVVASQQIAAATAQLVIASRVKADRGSIKMAKVSQASKNVTQATGQVVATAKSCAEMVEESEEMDFSKLSLHQAKRLEVESQVRVLELENMLVKERMKLAGLRKQHYQLAGASEGWEEKDIAQ